MERSSPGSTRTTLAPELIRIYDKLFERPELPAEQRALRRVAMSNAHYRAAQCLFWSKRFSEARREVARAVRWAPLNLRAPILYAVGGSAALQLLERWRGNPFRLDMEP